MRAVEVGDAAIGTVVKLVAEDDRRVKPPLPEALSIDFA